MVMTQQTNIADEVLKIPKRPLNELLADYEKRRIDFDRLA